MSSLNTIMRKKADKHLESEDFYKRFFWSRFSEQQLKRCITRVCARERFNIRKLKPYFWVTIRLKIVNHFEESFGQVPAILKFRRLPRDPFQPSKNKEFQYWWYYQK